MPLAIYSGLMSRRMTGSAFGAEPLGDAGAHHARADDGEAVILSEVSGSRSDVQFLRAFLLEEKIDQIARASGFASVP